MADKRFYGPLWEIPVTGAGVNAGTSLMSGLTDETAEYYEAAAKGIIISCPSANSGDAYLVSRFSDGTFKLSNAGTVVCVIPKGTTRQFPQAEYGGNRYKLSEYAVVAALNDLAYVAAIMQ